VKEFYIQREMDEQFGQFNISLQIDLVWVSDTVKPTFDEPYPPQVPNGDY